MKLKGLGEFSLIDRLTKQMRAYDGSVILGIGDDAAAFRVDGKNILVTCDMLVEGHHFVWDWITPEQLGHKALAVSLSDIAAMGGIPRYALISAGWPSELELDYADGIYKGVGELAASYGVFIIGGDTVSAPQLILDVTVIGEMGGNPVTRTGAVVGHVFAVTGTLGAAAAGLALLKKGDYLPGVVIPEQSLSAAEKQALLLAQLQPRPRIKEAGVLLKAGSPSAMIDISDGLASEIHHICKGSGVGAEVDTSRLPVDGRTKKAAEALEEDFMEWVLYGGEDYELLVTLPEHNALIVKKELVELGVQFTVIGKVTDKANGINLLREDGSAVSLGKKGYNHFSDYEHEN